MTAAALADNPKHERNRNRSSWSSSALSFLKGSACQDSGAKPVDVKIAIGGVARTIDLATRDTQRIPARPATSEKSLLSIP